MALSERDQATLVSFIDGIRNADTPCIGYPANVDFDFSELDVLLKYPLNNVGDPMMKSSYVYSSLAMEREVVAFFTALFRADPENTWGYVTNGGSEGNLYGLYLARELYPKAMVYYSESTHYSVHKNIHLLNMPSIVIRAQANGEIDYKDLGRTIKMNRHLPVVILANIGTTMTEALDDLGKINLILKNNAITKKYIHCDGALSGTFAPFMSPRPQFDFTDGADSIAISGHKFIGSPTPCGVILAKKANRDRIARGVSYIDSIDTTITGSRNGHSPVYLWYTIKKLGIGGLQDRYERCLSLAAYTLQRLQDMGIAAWKNDRSITVVFPEPGAELKTKWQLATENGFSHIICMPGVTKMVIDRFLNDLAGVSKIAKPVLRHPC
jgi:histidine decarboxylase